MKEKKIAPCLTTLPGNREGAAFAQHLINRSKKGGAGKKKAKSKKRIVKAPIGGWRGGDAKDNGAK